ncbi:MAG TPA: hypothetical protein VEK07_06870 [Polyangiaceae bacterium]|nr:hypothetical protein [Polyangiaceae bacterium]
MSTLIPEGAGRLAFGSAIGWGALGALVAAVPALWMWGFTVDDALISVRYARHVATGIGWRFNSHGASTDGVTPLPWPVLLAPFARAGALTVLGRAKAIGLCVWVATGAVLGRSIGRRASPAWARLATLIATAFSVPLAAYAVSGMETAIATSFATFAVLARSPRAVALLAGSAAAFRPEMAPWAFVFSSAIAAVAGGELGQGRHAGEDMHRKVASTIVCGVLSVVPFGACALVRVCVWGRPAPLAMLAKPGDVSYGLAYAGAATFVTVLPILVVAPVAVRRSPRAAAIVLAALAHACSVVIVGGDWMPYARLFVPILPSLAVAAALLSEHANRVATAFRSLAAVSLGAVLVSGGAGGRRVSRDRQVLIAAARPLLADARHVAVLDVGWVSAATETDIVDLAGVTDPQIAALPGGHTSKRVSAAMLLERAPDLLLLYAPEGLPDGLLAGWRNATFRGAVEARLARDDVIARHFAASSWLPLGEKGAGYVVLSRRDSDP